VGLGAIVLETTACTQILGLKEGTPLVDAGGGRNDRAAPPACGGYDFSKVETCGKCMHEQCCDSLAACRVDTSCNPWQSCNVACASDDWTCLGRCVQGDMGGVALTRTDRAITDVGTCKFTRCLDQCPLTDLPAMLGGGSCAECVAQKCANETKAFGGDVANSAPAIECFYDTNAPFSPDPASMLTCGNLWYAPSFAASQQWSICLGLVCPVECNLGRFMECTGRYDFPVPQSATVTITALVLN
jgi:hypothetical protein